MENMEINNITGNKMIAAFAGINVSEFSWNDFISLVYCDEDGEWSFSDLEHYTPNVKWDQLMQVVAKIKSIYPKWDGFVEPIIFNLIEALKTVNIDILWQAVINVIQWHNQQQTVQEGDATMLPKDQEQGQ